MPMRVAQGSCPDELDEDIDATVEENNLKVY